MTDKEAIEEMTQWIESPMEFGKKPTEIHVLDSKKIFWPSKEIEEAFLIKYTMSDGEEYIGFTGPVTWSFFDIDFKSLSKEDLYERYTGWFICFISHNSNSTNKSDLASDKDHMVEKLKALGYQDLIVNQNVLIANENFYEIKAVKEGHIKFVVGSVSQHIEYDSSTALPLYAFAGEMWNPLNID